MYVLKNISNLAPRYFIEAYIPSQTRNFPRLEIFETYKQYIITSWNGLYVTEYDNLKISLHCNKKYIFTDCQYAYKGKMKPNFGRSLS